MEIYTNRHLRKSTFTLNQTKNALSALVFTSISASFYPKIAFIYISRLPHPQILQKKIKKIKIFLNKIK